MPLYLQFLTTPSADTAGTTLVLCLDDKNYLFGSVGEGTQRACVQTGARLVKISDMFITGRSEWSNLGGLLGMILTMADINQARAATAKASLVTKALRKLKSEKQGENPGDEEIAGRVAKEAEAHTALRIFGPPNMNYLLASARRFILRKNTPLDVRELGAQESTTSATAVPSEIPPVFADEHIRVWALPIAPTNASDSFATRCAGCASPRKRSYDELNGVEPTEEQTLSSKEKDALVTRAVVAEMFGSTWRLDDLYECPIHEVKLPATLFIRDAETRKLVKYTGPLPGGTEPVPNIKVLIRRPWPASQVATLPPTKPAKESVSYIVKAHTRRGKFNPQEATRLEVEKGHKWSLLAKGESVKNIHGTVITPDMVLGESKEGGGAAIINLPSEDYVEALINRPEWSVKEIMSGVGFFVWMLGPGVAASPQLKHFMTRMKDYKHVISSSDLCPNSLSMTSAATATARLLKVDPARYGIPLHNNTEPLHHASADHTADLVAKVGMVLNIQPEVGVSTNSIEDPWDVEEVLKDFPAEVVEASKRSHADIRNSAAELEAWAESVPSRDAEIITLGTGSATPSKYRNVSATLVRVPGWGSILLDCGENTLGQLRRMYGEAELNDLMHDLRILWISHMHADHHLGTTSVLKAWYQAVHNAQPDGISLACADIESEAFHRGQKRLAVVSGLPMLKFLHEYSCMEDIGFSRIAPLILSAPSSNAPSESSSGLTWFRESSEQDSAYNYLRPVPASALGLSDIQAVHVSHCVGARAIAITLPSGFKVSYSGDCRPSRAFSEIGKGSTVCIHEATFDDELQGDAFAKRHSTTSEALGVALAMGAKTCVLTHFSQRYQKVPVLEYTEDDALPIVPTNDDSSMHDVDDEAAPVAIEEENATLEMPDDADEAAPDDEGDGRKSSSAVETRIKLPKGSDMKVCVAFDLMRVKVGEIAQLEKITPALIKMFELEEQGKERIKKENKVEMKKADKRKANKKSIETVKTIKPSKGEGGAKEGVAQPADVKA